MQTSRPVASATDDAATAALAASIASLIGDRDDPDVERAVFGTADPATIAAVVASFCTRHLRARIGAPLFYRSSVGAVFGLELEGGRRVVIKVHRPDYRVGYLTAVQRVLRHLVAHSFPAPPPVLDPTPLGQGTATVEALVAEGEYRDAHDPRVRHRLAAALAWLIELARGYADADGMRELQLGQAPPPGRLWGLPHSAMFDFDATGAGAEWIDDLAWRASSLLAEPAGWVVVGHCDWATKHVRFAGDTIKVIYDWDSLRVDPEPTIVGRAAHAFTAVYDTPLEGKVHTAPSYEEVLGFLEDYEAARGAPFTAGERRTFGAACAFSLAYSSRCSHALDPRSGEHHHFPPGTWRAALADFGERLLTL